MTFGEGFLAHPDLFPGRRGGEPWGRRSVVLEVAGSRYRVSGLSEAQEQAALGKRGWLATGSEEAGEEAVPIELFRAPREDFLDRDVRGWEYTLDRSYEPAGVRLAGLRLMGRIAGPPAPAGGLWTSEAGGEEWLSVFENFFRVMVAYRLLAAGGAVLHSAGVTDGRRAWLLLGPSGAGKTTTSRLCLERGASVLSDDLNAVRLDGGGAPRLLWLPFTGDLGEQAAGLSSFPLAALLRLVQGTEERLRPLSPGVALAGLVAAAPFVNHDPWRREALLSALEALALAVPAYELTFSREGDVWAILQGIPT